MATDSALPWTDRQWDDLRAVALESARKSRVASTFLPLVGPLPGDEATVPSNWMYFGKPDTRQPGEFMRMEVRSGRTLHLVTIACNVFLRGSEIADPDLSAAKAMVRRAGEVLGRLEDTIVFQGRHGKAAPEVDRRTIQPEIYTITGGDNLTGLLDAPGLLLSDAEIKSLRDTAKAVEDRKRRSFLPARIEEAEGERDAAVAAVADRLMCVRMKAASDHSSPIVDAVVAAIQRLEARGHFGPFAVVLGHRLFSDATTPSKALVLPTDRLAEFLDGRKVLRSGVLPANRGIVVALGGEPVELVLASDIDVTFLQVTLEPRYILRVFERFVLRIKELDAVCTVTSGDDLFPERQA